MMSRILASTSTIVRTTLSRGFAREQELRIVGCRRKTCSPRLSKIHSVKTQSRALHQFRSREAEKKKIGIFAARHASLLLKYLRSGPTVVQVSAVRLQRFRPAVSLSLKLTRQPLARLCVVHQQIQLECCPSANVAPWIR